LNWKKENGFLHLPQEKLKIDPYGRNIPTLFEHSLHVFWDSELIIYYGNDFILCIKDKKWKQLIY
jgi:hypothetical protein